MKQDMYTKLANNILEFLLDPTKIPLRQRMYFRPEENLKNEYFEDAKNDAAIAYGDQKHNSDMYPIRNRQLKMEVTKMGMDRKVLIASFDILAQNFSDKDPIAKELRRMASYVEKLSDEDLNVRLAKIVEVPKDTMIQKDDEEDAEEVEAYGIGKEAKLNEFMQFAKKFREKYMKENPDAPMKEVMKETGKAWRAEKKKKNSWTKSASDLVKQALVQDVFGGIESPVQEQQEEHEKEETPEEEAKEEGKKGGIESPVQEQQEEHEKEETPEEEAKEHGKKEEVEAAKKIEEKKEDVEAAKKMEEKPEEVEAKKKEKEVNTEILKSSFNGIELDAGIIDEYKLTAEEQKNLEKLF